MSETFLFHILALYVAANLPLYTASYPVHVYLPFLTSLPVISPCFYYNSSFFPHYVLYCLRLPFQKAEMSCCLSCHPHLRFHSFLCCFHSSFYFFQWNPIHFFHKKHCCPHSSIFEQIPWSRQKVDCTVHRHPLSFSVFPACLPVQSASFVQAYCLSDGQYPGNPILLLIHFYSLTGFQR